MVHLLLVSTLVLEAVYMWAPVCSQSECLMNRVQIISKNTTLLSPLNITATRFIHSYPPSYFGNFTSAVWCAPQGPNPNISLSFSHLVLITGFIPGGYSRNDGSYREYVTNFNLHYSETLDKKTFQELEFNISADNLDQLVMLEKSFLAFRLDIQVNSFVTVTGDVCMGMAIIGCHHSEASQIEQPSDKASVIPRPASTVIIETCGGVESTPALQCPQSQVVRDYQALIIALPIALGTILVTAAIVGVGVILCVRRTAQEKKHRISTASGTSHINLEDKLEENPVYNIPFQDEGGAIQITKNVSYAPTLSIPLHNSTTLVESSK